MLSVFTTAAMRKVDEISIGGNLTIGYSYMLKAGMGLFDAVRGFFPDPQGVEIAIFCGKGNNGGDGYVLGRILLDEGYSVLCYSLCDVESLSGEAKIAYSEYENRKGSSFIIDDVEDLPNLGRFSLIVDAMLGTGVKGDPHGLYALVIEAINASGVKVIAVDTPSGLNCDTGMPGNPCIMANRTVAMGFPKLGQFFSPGKNSIGDLMVRDLGYPEEVVVNQKENVYLPSLDALRDMLPPRKIDGSKFEHGLVMQLCGSRGMAGAATLTSLAALKSGCGMVHLAIPDSISEVMSIKVTEPVLHPVPQTSSGSSSLQAFDQLVSLSQRMDSACIGPGLSRDGETQQLVRKLVANITLPCILDADGISAYKDHAEELKNHSCDLIITPHKGEWKRLFGDLPEVPVQLIAKLRQVAAEYQMTILLKGNPSILASIDGNVYLLPYGNTSLATAGTGDVLSGIIASLLAQGASPVNAAILGAYIHGEAGVLAGEDLTEYSVLAGDLLNYISKVLKRIQR